MSFRMPRAGAKCYKTIELIIGAGIIIKGSFDFFEFESYT
jgi:hypothetical protein